jgi:hypothetical protein
LDEQIKEELARHLQGSLPDVLGQLETRLSVDDRLREICIEYEEVTMSRRHLAAPSGKDHEKFDEFTDLLRGLEKEMLDILTENCGS